MTHRFFITLIGFVAILALIAGGAAWYLVSSHQKAVGVPNTQATSTEQTFSGQAIYTNGPQGFVIRYPESAKVEDTFSSSYHLAATWRANALPNTTGTPVVSIITYDIQSDHSYPRYYSTMVRIGVSEDKKEIATCLVTTKDQGETPLPDVTFGGVTWKVFAFQNAGMMQYVKGISYRTMHEGKCVALEKIAVGSSYRDDPKSAEDMSDAELEKHYTALDQIVETFMFVRP